MGKKRNRLQGFWDVYGGFEEETPSEDNFVEFMSFFGYQLWQGQIDMITAAENVYLRKIDVEWPIMCCPSGHAIGKSFIAAAYAAFCAWRGRNKGGVYILQLSPNLLTTSNQEFNNVRGFCNLLSRFTDVKISDRGIEMGDSKIIPVAFNRRRHGENDFQGYHAPMGVIVFLNEAANFPKRVVESAYSCASGEMGLIWLNGNPISSQANDALSFSFKRAHPKASLSICSGDHPNVQQKREIIKGAVSWNYVSTNVDSNCIAYVHNYKDDGRLEDSIGTLKKHGKFSGVVVRLNFDTKKFKRGQVVIANEEACRRVLGIFMKVVPPSGILPVDFFDYNGSLESFYEEIKSKNIKVVSLGLDVARFGDDKGKLCGMFIHEGIMHNAIIDTFDKADTNTYSNRVLNSIRHMYDLGVRSFTLSIDGTGGYGAGVVDVVQSVNKGTIKIDSEDYDGLTWLTNMRKESREINLKVIDFLFSTSPKNKKDKRRYKTLASKHAKTMKNLAVKHVVKCYNWQQDDIDGAQSRKAITHSNKFILQSKKIHKAENDGQSPDGFDAFLLVIVSFSSSIAAYAGEESKEEKKVVVKRKTVNEQAKKVTRYGGRKKKARKAIRGVRR